MCREVGTGDTKVLLLLKVLELLRNTPYPVAVSSSSAVVAVRACNESSIKSPWMSIPPS